MVTGHYPKTVKEACSFLVQYQNTLLVNGGTDLMVMKKTAEHMVFLNQIQALKAVTKKDGVLSIGACATYFELLENEEVPEILKQVIRQIASPAIRDAGTMAGNVCNASPAGDTLPLLYALSAQVVLASLEQGKLMIKKMPIAQFILGIRQIKLAAHEIVIGIEISEDAWQDMNVHMYEKVGARKSEAISKLSLIGLGKVKKGILCDVRIAFGAVDITVVRRGELEAKWIGKKVTDIKAHQEEFINDYAAYIRPIDDQRSTASYRKRVCLNLLQEFINQLTLKACDEVLDLVDVSV